MNDLPMPSDVKAATPGRTSAPVPAEPAVEPLSVKLIVRLFLIPLLIVAAAVGVMFLIGRLAGGTPSFDVALERLKSPGGERTATYLLVTGAKQRHMDPKTLAHRMK